MPSSTLPITYLTQTWQTLPRTDEELRFFEQASALENAELQEQYGSALFDTTPEDMELALRPSQGKARVSVLALHGDELVGFADITLPLTHSPETAYPEILVAPEWRRRGIGRELWRRTLEYLTAADRTLIHAWTLSPQPAPGEPVIGSPVGVGQVPSTNPAVQFALAMGFTIGQVDRESKLELSRVAAELPERLKQATTKAGPAYEVLTFDEPVPDELLPKFAKIESAMSTDVPAGAREVQAVDLDPEIYREGELRAVQRGIRVLTAAVRHIESQDIVAYSVLRIPKNPASPVGQDSTLVVRAHRGHGLGMLVKLANLVELERHLAGTDRNSTIYTWNAFENEHMLRVNIDLGFELDHVSAAIEYRIDANRPTSA